MKSFCLLICLAILLSVVGQSAPRLSAQGTSTPTTDDLKATIAALEATVDAAAIGTPTPTQTVKTPPNPSPTNVPSVPNSGIARLSEDANALSRSISAIEGRGGVPLSKQDAAASREQLQLWIDLYGAWKSKSISSDYRYIRNDWVNVLLPLSRYARAALAYVDGEGGKPDKATVADAKDAIERFGRDVLPAIQDAAAGAPAPTASPVTRATSTPVSPTTSGPNEQKYLKSLKMDSEQLLEDIDAIAADVELFNRTGKTNLTPDDLKLIWNRWIQYGEDYAGLTPPSKLRELHELWLEILDGVIPYAESSLDRIFGDGPKTSDRIYSVYFDAADELRDVFMPMLKEALGDAGIGSSTPRPTRTPTPETSGIMITVSGNDVSRSFTLAEGSHRATVNCSGSASFVFVTLETAPGADGFIFENLVLGEELPYSGTSLVRIWERSRVVVTIESIGGTARCTVEINN